jgi:hypothetical protein
VIVELVDSRALDKAGPAILARAGSALVVMPYIDRTVAQRCATLMASRANEAGMILCIHDDDREGFISLVNRVFGLSTSRFFGYVAQDAFPGRQWLSLAVAALNSTGKGLFAFNDGKWMGALASFGLASRAWAQGNYDGNFFYPGYVSHYADVELSVLAMSERSYCYDANSVLVEVDWGKDKAPVNPNDRALFQQRKLGKFGGRVQMPALLNLFS